MKKLITLLFLLSVFALYANQVENSNLTNDSNLAKESLFKTSSESITSEIEYGTALEAKLLSIKAFECIKKLGKEKAFKKFLNNQSTYHNKDLYIFVIDMEGNVLIHAEDSDLMNKNLIDLKDSKGKYFIRNFIKIMNNFETGWSEYYWRNYSTQEIETKLTYLIKIDDNSFLGCGAYQK